MSDMDDLIPQTRKVKILRLDAAGEVAERREVVVMPLRMRQYPGFTKAIAKPYTLILQGMFLGAITEFYDDVMGAVSIATELDKDLLGELFGDGYMKLATAVLELNQDFLRAAVLPEARKAAELLERMLDISAPSPASSAPDTGTTTSSTSPLPN